MATTTLTVEFGDEENRIIGIVKAQFGLQSKDEAIRRIIRMHDISQYLKTEVEYGASG